MILNVRGASGSGKSTLARYVMDACVTREPLHAGARRRPVGYLCRPVSGPLLMVLGHYEIANGGVDTLDLSLAYQLARFHADKGRNVLFEGKTLRDTSQRVIDLAREHQVAVIHLTTEVPTCVERIRKRLSPFGKPHDIAPRSVEAMARKCARDAERIRAAGINCLSLSLEEAKATSFVLLGL